METYEMQWTTVHEVVRFQLQYGGLEGPEYGREGARARGRNWKVISDSRLSDDGLLAPKKNHPQ